MESLGLKSGFWKSRRVLVTGHTGFKGGWLAFWLAQLGASVSGLALAPESDDGVFQALELSTCIESRIVDIRNDEQIKQTLTELAPELVFHLAAQPLVGRGWRHPTGTYQTNIIGTANLLDACARTPSVRGVVVVTSDKVYSSNGPGPFKESAQLGGSDPYSVSKVAVEMIVDAWRSANPNIPIVTARAGNVIGGGDIAEERLLPDLWRALVEGKPVALRNPDGIRPWQFVLDPLAGYLALAELVMNEPDACPPAINFGPSANEPFTVRQVVACACDCWGEQCAISSSSEQYIEVPALTLDSSLAREKLDWAPRLDLPAAIQWTVDWWKASRNQSQLKDLAGDQLRSYANLKAGR